MTEKEFRTNIELKKEMELSYRGTKYRLSYGLDNDGTQTISFAEADLPPKRYRSYAELMSSAKVGIHPLRYAVESFVLLN